MKKKVLYGSIAIVLIVAALLTAFIKKPVDYTNFAQCLTEKGAKMYGAWWCPHCNNQKKTFGDAWHYVTYVECSTQDGKETDDCKAAGITGYPTWRFSDGTELQGEATFEQLSQRTSCSLQ
jgi:hypothetical protein